MAYTSSPQFDTYKSTGITFDGEDLFRSGDLSINRDLQIVNCYYDKISQTNKTTELFVVKRPGFVDTSWSLSKASATDKIRGGFYDTTTGLIYYAVNSAVYALDITTNINRTVTSLTTTEGNVGFCDFLKSDNTHYVVFSDGVNLFVDTPATSTCVEVTDDDLPTPHQPYPLYIDGYIALIKSDTGDIYNSDNDDPMAWTPGNFITAEMSSDKGIRLIKAKNYFVVLGQNSLEYFYDAGIEDGSPFQRQDSPYRSVGYYSGCCTIGDTTYFVGNELGQNLEVFALKDFKVESISTSVVNRTLQVYSDGQTTKAPIEFDRTGNCISINGKNFYCLVTHQTTWLYDIDLQVWYEWKDTNNLGLSVEYVWSILAGQVLVALKNKIVFAYMSNNTYQDFNVNYTCKYITEEFTAQTYNWKTLHRMFVIADQWNNIGVSNMNISWSDDNGKTWSNPRPLNLFSKSPFITRCGRFRKRMFKLEYADNYPLRMRALELELNVGAN